MYLEITLLIKSWPRSSAPQLKPAQFWVCNQLVIFYESLLRSKQYVYPVSVSELIWKSFPHEKILIEFFFILIVKSLTTCQAECTIVGIKALRCCCCCCCTQTIYGLAYFSSPLNNIQMQRQRHPHTSARV